MKIDDLQNLKEPLHKILLITNRERVTLQWQNLSSSNQSKQREQQDRLNCVLFNRTAREEHSFPWLMLLPKTHNLDLIVRKYQTNLNWGTVCKITCLDLPTY